MGRAGGRGGGGRSGGFGGSRGGSFGGSRGGSFGGGSRSRSSSGSSFGRSSSFGSSRPRSSGSSWSGGFWGTPRVSGPIIINNSGNRNYNSPNNNGNYPNYSGNNNRNTQNQNNGMGCVHIALIMVMIISIIVLLFNSVVILGSDNKERVKLSADVNETAYFTDELGWINDSATLIEGMEHFYDLTGVQPHLYITDNVGGSFYDYAEEFANNKYDELFTDEAHLLLIFHEKNDWYDTYCLAGSTADTVIDSEARMILLDTLDEYYYDSSLDDNEYFSKAFSDAADEIMKKASSNIVVIIIPLIIFIAALAAEIIIRKKAKEEKRKKELKEMLDKPLETFGSTEAAELAKKYDTTAKTTTDKNSVTETSKVQSEANAAVDGSPQDKNCDKCGSELEENSNFCSSCGEKVEK